MAEIKPAEISAILKKQVESFESGASLEEVGTVLQVGALWGRGGRVAEGSEQSQSSDCGHGTAGSGILRARHE